MSKGLTDVPGIKVGHSSDYDAFTGCTAILCEQGAVAGVDIRGSATGTEELGVLNPLHVTPQIHAIVLSGGSAFGLEAASGVRYWLEKKGIGFPTGAARVPLVVSAILYDLGFGKADVRPTRESGRAAAEAATAGPVAEGAVGAGTGATVGKLFGMKRAMKSGLGSATVALEGDSSNVLVSALAVVNAVGDVRDLETGHLIAGARVSEDSLELAGSAALMKQGRRSGFAAPPHNTTLVVVATNARLSKVAATKLAQLGSLGVARAIEPVWTMSDGDIVFALSCGEAQASVDALGVAAAEAVAKAIARAARLAPTMGGLPGMAGNRR